MRYELRYQVENVKTKLTFMIIITQTQEVASHKQKRKSKRGGQCHVIHFYARLTPC
jgi:hypothetical protein